MLNFIFDPMGWALAHWPALLAVAVLISLCFPATWTFWIGLVSSRVGQIALVCFVVISATWAVRGWLDGVRFEKERAGFRETIAQIEDTQKQAIIDAQNKAREAAEKSQDTLRAALGRSEADKAASSAEAAALRRGIEAMQSDERADPMLLKIIRGKK